MINEKFMMIRASERERENKNFTSSAFKKTHTDDESTERTPTNTVIKWPRVYFHIATILMKQNFY